jgi:selenium-dependent xanthine dehydrogenase
MPTLDFILNGNRRLVEYEEGASLLDVLRDGCGILSPKNGCAPEGICGCCTVLVDNRPALSCLKKPAAVEGREVRTLEGLDDRERSLLARAFTEEHAVQCGFCTPGIALRLHALLERDPDPAPDAVRRALSGHLCRCTGYKSIERAAGRLARLRREPDSCDCAPRDGGIGADMPRYRGADLVLGAKPFAADLERTGLLHGALVFSPHPRARLLSLDMSEARSLPGVVEILTAADIPGERHVGLLVQDWPLLVAVGEETRCVGDVLALVVAETALQARRAAAAVRGQWQVLEPVSLPEAALAEDAPRLHPAGNLLETCAFRRGDVEAALAASAVVVEMDFQTQRIEHAFLEPEACLAEPEGDGLRVMSPGQGVHDDQRQIASLLGLAKEQVTVELVSNGGAFGGKEDLSVQGHASLAAWRLQRPVKVVLSRAESLRLHPKRHPLALSYRVGADAEGRLTAAHVRIVGDTGAYASVGGKVLERAAGHSCGPYRVPCVDVEAKAVLTNNPPCGAMRGFGANQAAFAIEGVLDEIAARLALDRWEIRRRNILRPGDRFATGQLMRDSVRGLERCLDAVRPVMERAPAAGLALGIKNTGIGNGLVDTGRVRIRVLAGGRLQIHTGYTEMGQGLFTILRQIVHEETGLPLDSMEVGTLSDLAVLCGMTTASRATALAGAAAGRAARQLREALDGRSVGELAGREFRGEFLCDITTAPGADVAEPVTHMTFSFAAQVVELDDAGRIARVTAAHDVGRAINPASCRGQIEGSLHMGLGYALSEDFPCTGGVPDSLRLKDCGVLRAHETPDLEVILVEEPDEVGGYGVRGVGEIGLVPTAAAVASALRARDGRARTRLPMRGDLAACLGRRGADGAEVS